MCQFGSHNIGMDPGEQLAADILDAISSGRDLWVFDRYNRGPDRDADDPPWRWDTGFGE
jgi:hypothetical protein